MRTAKVFVCGMVMLAIVLAGGDVGSAPIESKLENGVLKLTCGASQVSCDPAKGMVDLRCGNVTVAGKGTLFRLSPGPGGKVAVTDLTSIVKEGKPLVFGALDVLAARVLLYETPPCVAVAVLNPDTQSAICRVPLAELGLPGDGTFAGYDLATDEFVGPISGTLFREVKGGSCALIALGRAADRPVVLCTSRSMAEGPDDIEKVEWNAEGKALSGGSSVAKDARYELRILAPPEPVQWVAEAAAVSDEDKKAGVTTDIIQTGPWLRVSMKSPQDRRVNWRIAFGQKPAAKISGAKVSVSAAAVSPRWVQVRCYSGGRDVVIRRNDGVEFSIRGHCLNDTAVSPGTAYTYSVCPVIWTGKAEAIGKAEVKTPDLPPMPPLPEVYLSDLQPVKAVNGWNGEPRKDKSIEDNPIRIRGETFKRGMGVHAKSELVYNLTPQLKRFVAVVGVDDEKGRSGGSVTFEVYADDKPLFKSAVLTPSDEMAGINVEIPKDAKQIRLIVGDGGNGIACDHADWANAGFLTMGEKYVAPAAPAPPGVETLFNGKDLTGWDGNKGFWSVKDGVIHGETTAEKPTKGNTFLIWRGGKLKDFILKLKFRIPGGNSGVQYRSQDLGNWTVGGYQAEVVNAPGGAGLLYHERGRGMLTQVGEFVIINEKGEKQVVGKVSDKAAISKAGYYKNSDWNEYTITARGNHIVQEINGYPMIELIDNDPKGSAREGILALQLHAGPPMVVEYKDIWLKPLKANYGGALRLFNGQNLDGWTFSIDALKDTWSVKDGVMVNQGQPPGYVRTTADYDNYVVRVQLRHITKGNSGVLLRMVGPDKVWPKSIEAQGMIGCLGDIWDIDEFPIKVAPERTKGRHTAKMHPSNERPLGEWNQYEITLDGGNLEIKVNDLVQNTATDCWETPGKICLQSEGAQVEYRNVVLVPIIREKR